MMIFLRRSAFFLLGFVVVTAMTLALPKCEGKGSHPFTRVAHVTMAHQPPSQVVDGLYKSLVIVTPGGQTMICILTRLPMTRPHFTIPPEYSCVKA